MNLYKIIEKEKLYVLSAYINIRRNGNILPFISDKRTDEEIKMMDYMYNFANDWIKIFNKQ